ncbi:hypothetical protein J6590_000090 [Homalodisca vitripennis]|nr:hypothetical protein J6590_000090 [Homalodisca vitripennis]
MDVFRSASSVRLRTDGRTYLSQSEVSSRQERVLVADARANNAGCYTEEDPGLACRGRNVQQWLLGDCFVG